jgi:hypothetical protein
MRHAALAILSAAALLASCDRRPTAPEAAAGGAGASDAARAAAPSAGPSASGSATILFGATVERLVFHAEQRGGTATGHAFFNDKTAGVRGHVDVNCLLVVGNVASISGIVTKSNDPTIVGFEALFQVQDNGDGHRSPPDLSSTVMLHEVGVGPNCLVPREIDMVPIRHGNIEVRP